MSSALLHCQEVCRRNARLLLAGGIGALAIGYARSSLALKVIGVVVFLFGLIGRCHRSTQSASSQAGQQASRAEPLALGSARKQVQKIVAPARVDSLVEKAVTAVSEIIANTTQPFPAYAIIGIRIESVDGLVLFAGTMNLVLQHKPLRVALHEELEKSLRDYLAKHEIAEFKVGVCFATQVKGGWEFDLRITQGSVDPSYLEKRVELENEQLYPSLTVDAIQKLAFGFFPVFKPAEKGLEKMLRSGAPEGASVSK